MILSCGQAARQTAGREEREHTMNIFVKLMWLQLFAEAGTLVNATGNYVNAYTGETQAFAGANSFDPTLKTFYDTELLENARTSMYYAQFAKRQPLPKNHGGTVEWRKWNTFARAGKLQEGVIPTGQKFGITNLIGSIDQYGTYTAITDKLELRAYDPVILGATEEMGASAAETQEWLIRQSLLAGTNVLYCDNVTVTQSSDELTYAFESTPTDQAGMKASNNVFSLMTGAMVARAATLLKKNKVPKIGGYYYAVIHPSVVEDLRACKGWMEAHKYAQPEEIYNGEVGKLHGVRFIEDEFAPVLKGGPLASDSTGLKVAAAVSTASDTITFDGGTVAAGALVGRQVTVGGKLVTVTANTASALTVTPKITAVDNADILPGEGAAGNAAAYATFFFGKDGFGIIDPEGGALEMIVHDKDEIGGPLNQFSTVGYKFETNGATMLYPERVLRVMSCSYRYSATDEAN